MNDLAQMLLASTARHVLTGLAGTFITIGWIHSNQQGAFVEIGTGIVLGAAGAVWSWWQKGGAAKLADQLKRLTKTTTTKAAVAKAATLPDGSAVTKGLP